ncbi:MULTISPECIES: type II toxin-antitoxin system VapC family toxin [Metallosphaera]|uniref:type II toxin-antitoxin system VapC family toxin n=1 Tax=Metallosphaera TaxID=41980 RepID=UPI001F0616B8|nr:type II toxin-antitoxin system VapC family toxin [Metallosphaera sedula]MCH1771171.1 type II toxin-antitoxin system VapC family toxin [Metallosphaera sedula]MCP6729543.1 type II toxin-antitoxin system VapC family toxin [Metallosphaera sedula]
MAVVDASVVVKWFANEEYSDESVLLKEAYARGLEDLSAPCILPFEVLNGLRYTYGLGERELEEVGKILEDFQFTLYGFESFIKDAVHLSSVYGITVYDASYVALGKILGQTVYTADEKLLRKVKELGFVVHIRDYRVT